VNKLPSILTIKQKEAEEACAKMNTNFLNLNTQITTTHNDSYKPLESKTNSLKNKENDMLDEAIYMNDLPTD
jgi:hypothetical protein